MEIKIIHEVENQCTISDVLEQLKVHEQRLCIFN